MKVKLKSLEKINEMIKNDEIEIMGSSDSGEITHYGTKGNPSHVISLWFSQYEEEY